MAISLLAMTRGLPQARAATAHIAFSPSAATVGVGGNVVVDITVDDVSNLGGYNIYLQFNPAFVQLLGLEDAGFVTSGENIVVCNDAMINNAAGTATLSCATVAIFGPPGPGVSTVTPRALAHAVFQGMASGTSSLTLTGTQLLDPNDNPLPATAGSGSISVGGMAVGGVTELSEPGALLVQRTGSASGWGDPLAALAVIVLSGAGLLCAFLAWRPRQGRE